MSTAKSTSLQLKKISIVDYIFIVLTPLLFIFLYYSTFEWLYERYTAIDSYYSHGFLIPIISGFFIWQKRQQVKINQDTFSKSGFYLIITALGIHIISVYIHVFFISGFSILILVLGIFLFIFGKQITTQLYFSIFYLIFMLPLPLSVIKAISIPVKSIAMHISVDIVSFIGIPILQSGFYLHLPSGILLIGGPCSGLRSLISFLAMAAIFAYLLKSGFIKKFLILAISIPIAIFSNILRILFLIIVSYLTSVEHASPGQWAHDYSGMVVFIFGFLCLLISWRLIE